MSARRNLSGRFPGLAIVAGASEGLGAAFSRELAREGCPLLLVARRSGPLEELATELRASVPVRALACDLSRPDAIESILGAVASDRVGFVVYNAAVAPVGRLMEQTDATIDALLSVNAVTPLRLLRALRAAGTTQGFVIVSSMAGWQGSPMLAGYSATKAFLRVLGEALWYEFGRDGGEVVVTVPGAVDTPGYRKQSGSAKRRFGVLDPRRIARGTLRSVGHGPLYVPGLIYRFSVVLMNRILPRRWAISVMGSAGVSLDRTRRSADGS